MAGLAPETAHCAVVHGLRCPVEPVLCAALGRHSPSPPLAIQAGTCTATYRQRRQPPWGRAASDGETTRAERGAA